MWLMCFWWLQMMCMGAPVPPPSAAALEREKVAAHGVMVFTAGRPACRGQLLGGVHTPLGAAEVPVLAKSVRAYGSGLESRRFPKPHHWYGAGRWHLRPPVPTCLSLSLSPARTCPPQAAAGAHGRRLDSQAVVLTAVAWRKGALRGVFGSQQWLPPHLSLAAGKKSEAARGEQADTPLSPMGMMEAGQAHGWRQQPPAPCHDLGRTMVALTPVTLAQALSTLAQALAMAVQPPAMVVAWHQPWWHRHWPPPLTPGETEAPWSRPLAVALHRFKLFRSEIFPPDTLTSGAASIFHVDQSKFPWRQRRNAKHVILGTSSFFLQPKLGHASRGEGMSGVPPSFPLMIANIPPPQTPFVVLLLLLFGKTPPLHCTPTVCLGQPVPASAWVRVSMPGFAAG